MVTQQCACVTAVCVYSGVYDDKETAESAGLSLAEIIASKSPIAIQGSKVNMVYSRDNTVENALGYAVSHVHPHHTHTHSTHAHCPQQITHTHTPLLCRLRGTV